MQNLTPSELDRFWSKVDKSADCWVWTGDTSPSGYGDFRVKGKHLRAHRLSLAIARGYYGARFYADHTCYNRACVNPSHLRWVTPKQNQENRQNVSRKNASGIRGVMWYSKSRRWVAKVGHNGKRIHVGYFDTIEEAARAVAAKRCELFTHNDADRI